MQPSPTGGLMGVDCSLRPALERLTPKVPPDAPAQPARLRRRWSQGTLNMHQNLAVVPKAQPRCPNAPDSPETPSMWHPHRKSVTVLALVSLLAAGGIFALQGEARATYCQEYETSVVIPPNRPVKAIGRVCQVNGKWYLANFEPGEMGR